MRKIQQFVIETAKMKLINTESFVNWLLTQIKVVIGREVMLLTSLLPVLGIPSALMSSARDEKKNTSL